MLFAKQYGFSAFTTRYGFFPCVILNTDQHGQNTEFFSLKYKSPYIDFKHLEKTLNPYFFGFPFSILTTDQHGLNTDFLS